jgi:hypothetical protein
MIHDSCAASSRCMAAHWSRGVAVRPGRQNSLSSSITGRLVISPRRAARVDLPAAPGPVIVTLFTFVLCQFCEIASTSLGQVRLTGRAHLTLTERTHLPLVERVGAHLTPFKEGRLQLLDLGGQFFGRVRHGLPREDVPDLARRLRQYCCQPTPH